MNKQTTVPASVKALLAKIGSQLKETREAKNLSREDVCRSLKMHINFVIALEEGIFEDLPGAASFFASLRTYSRFLGLDADRLIQECKKNKFLFEAFQGEGLIQRNSYTEIAEQEAARAKHAPASLPKLQVDKDTPRPSIPDPDQEVIAKEKKQQKEQQAKIRKSNSLPVVFVVSALLLLGALGTLLWFGPQQLGLPLPEAFSDSIYGIRAMMLPKRPCKQFKLNVKEVPVDIKIEALSIGQTILDRTVDPGEELKFSDAEGVKIVLGETEPVELLYNNKTISWEKIRREDGSFLYHCR